MVMELKLPPRIKVLEALGAIADGRVEKTEEGCKVVSSERDKQYEVKIKGQVVYSDDNGTRFRGYIGYPIISCLMLNGALPFDDKYVNALKGIPWKRLNEEYKNYARVEEIVFKVSEERGVKREELEKFVDHVMNKLKTLHLRR
jgi:hypothetical protein